MDISLLGSILSEPSTFDYITTSLTAASTVAVAAFTYTLWRTTERLWAVNVGSRSDSRAWIVYESIQIGRTLRVRADGGHDDCIGLAMRFKNVGASPALNCALRGKRVSAKPEDPVPLFDIGALPRGYVTVGPQRSTGLPPTLVFVSDIELAILGKSKIFIHGKVEYNDIFEPVKIRSTEVTVQLFVKRIVGSKHPVPFEFATVEVGPQNICT